MRVERLRKERVAGHSRVTADVIWEDRDEPSLPLIMEVSEQFADDLDASADACLLALFPLAQWHGESRIRVDGDPFEARFFSGDGRLSAPFRALKRQAPRPASPPGLPWRGRADPPTTRIGSQQTAK